MKHTGLALAKIEQHIERDHFMSPAEAQDFGLVDKVLTSPPKMYANTVSDASATSPPQAEAQA